MSILSLTGCSFTRYQAGVFISCMFALSAVSTSSWPWPSLPTSLRQLPPSKLL